MKFFDGYRTGSVLVVCVGVLVLGGGRGAKADFTLGIPTDLGPEFTDWVDRADPSISADGLELYFGWAGTRGLGGWWDIWVSKRQTEDDPWGEASMAFCTRL